VVPASIHIHSKERFLEIPRGEGGCQKPKTFKGKYEPKPSDDWAMPY